MTHLYWRSNILTCPNGPARIWQIHWDTKSTNLSIFSGEWYAGLLDAQEKFCHWISGVTGWQCTQQILQATAKYEYVDGESLQKRKNANLDLLTWNSTCILKTESNQMVLSPILSDLLFKSKLHVEIYNLAAPNIFEFYRILEKSQILKAYNTSKFILILLVNNFEFIIILFKRIRYQFTHTLLTRWLKYVWEFWHPGSSSKPYSKKSYNFWKK